VPPAPSIARAPSAPPDPSKRWELYKLLADPVRARLLALAHREEAAVGELAEALGEAQPKISRHAAALRERGLLAARRNGTWTLLRLPPEAMDDAVVADAVHTALAACEADGTLRRFERVLAERDAATREFFARGGRPLRLGPPPELGAYLAPFAELLPERRLAIDVGCGDGPLLEVLSPIFERVIAVDSAEAQLGLARARCQARGLGNVELVHGEADSPRLLRAVEKAAARGADHRAAPTGADHRAAPTGADVVFASRMLHHARVPARALRALVELCRKPTRNERGGALVVLDYEAHNDVRMREQEADLWLGFDPAELRRLGVEAGLGAPGRAEQPLDQPVVRRLPEAFRGEGPDQHLRWQTMVGRRVR
jgi:ArsR family transcriptional regulator